MENAKDEVNLALEEEKARTLSLQAQVEEQAKQLEILQAAVRIKPDSEMNLEDWKKETMALSENKTVMPPGIDRRSSPGSRCMMVRNHQHIPTIILSPMDW